MVMVFFHGNLGFSQFSTCHPVADLLRRTDAVGICRDLLAIDARIRLLSDFRAFRYAWTCRGDCGGWNRSGEKGKYVSGSRRCIGLEPRCCHGRPNVNRHPGHVLAFAVRGTRIRSGRPCRPGVWLNPDQHATYLRD